MIALQLNHPRLLQSQAARPSHAQACFQPLDPGIVNAALPTFFIGRDRDGFWIARDAGGQRGGLFLLKSSALAFARRAARPFGCATILLSERAELDVENLGNPLIDYLRPIARLVTEAWKRWRKA